MMDDTNECFGSYSHVTSEERCREATVKYKQEFFTSSIAANSLLPKGCFYSPLEDAVMFNPHESGSPVQNTELICEKKVDSKLFV